MVVAMGGVAASARARAVLVAALLAAAATGCADDPGELDPETVHDLARTQGDAEGLEWDGDYDAEVTPVDCGCPELPALEGASLCVVAGPNASTLFFAVEVVHTDGFVLLRYQDLSLTGPIDDDGDFAAGGLFDMTTLVSEGDIVTRIDGEFSSDDGTRQFEGVLRQRIDGSAAVELGSPDSMQSVDCVETFSVLAEMR